MTHLAPSTRRSLRARDESQLASWYAPSFSDALGDRLLLCDNTDGDTFEMLRLRPRLTVHPEFEARLRSQTLLLKGFQSTSFARIHSVERLEETSNALAIVSSHIPGVRLSQVLHRAAQERRALPLDAALFIIRQLALALGALQSHASGLIHGALSPERVVLTARGSVVVVEHVLGASLAKLGYDQQRFWTELHLGTLAGIGTRIDARTDVVQIGLVGLSTILGRNLSLDDFPRRLDALMSEANSVLRSENGRYRSDLILHWLERALQRARSRSFSSAVEAANALEDWGDEAPEAAHGPRAQTDATRQRNDRLLTAGEPDESAGAPSYVPLPVEPPSFVPQDVLGGFVRQKRRIWIPASAVAASLAGTLAFVGIRAAEVSEGGSSALVVTTVPSGATVRIDGKPMGVTPLRQALDPGTYQLEVSKDGETRTFAIELRRNHELAQYIEMTGARPEQLARRSSFPAISLDVPVIPVSSERPNAAEPAPGGLLFVSSPLEIEVFHEGRSLGIAGGSRTLQVPAGRLVLDLVNRELDFRTTTTINVESGRRQTVAVALPLGVLHVNAQPWAEVWIDGKRIGETPIGNMRLPLGRHEIVFQHPDLGTASQDVVVKASGESRVSMDLRRR